MRIKDIVIIGMMSALLLIVQVGLGFLPNIELVSLLIILYTLIFGRKTLYIIYVFVAMEGLLYGFGLWWFSYLYLWTILFIITMIFRKERSSLFWAIISGAFGISFGALCSILNIFLSGIPSAVAFWFSGIPFDILHGIGNYAIALMLFKPLYHLLNEVHKKYYSIPY